MFGLFKKKPQPIDDEISKDHLITSLREKLGSMNDIDRITVGGQEMFNFLMIPHKDDTEPRLPIQIFLCISSMLAGYAAQVAVRAESPETILEIVMNNGQKFYLSDGILQKIFIEKYSPWSFVGGSMKQIGKTKIFKAFDIQECIGHSAQVMGSDDFYAIRVPKKHQPDVLTPKDFVGLWKTCSEHLGAIIPDQQEWASCYGFVLQQTIIHAKDIIDPNVALTIIAESMLIASKLDLPPKEK